ncbi:hypothetical protein [Accumulibacter sp.]|uniref:hypothetical protein n=1 Tax=Accumulibacter sp. TaxID=2053492 RepID=UPI0028C3E45B|nr:hypothetical protein [Accumulibacter sp.]
MGIFDWLFGSSKNEFVAPPRDVQPIHVREALTSNSNGYAFRFGNEETLLADAYGVKSIHLAIEAARKAIEEIIGDNQSIIQQKIFARRGEAQLHFMALQIAVYYVLADKLCSSNRNVLNEIAKGIAYGLKHLFNDVPDANMPQYVYEIFQEYAESLVRELNNPPTIHDPFDMGATADLVTEYVSKQCLVDTLLADNPAEEFKIKMHASGRGITILFLLLIEKRIAFVG